VSGPDAPARRPARTAIAASVRCAALLLALGLAGCAPAETADEAAGEGAGLTPAAGALPDVVRIEDPGLHPEGVEYDAGGERFLVSSVTRGTVTAVGDDGRHEVFITDPDITSSIGIHIDRSRGRLLVANSNVAVFQDQPGHARLGAYDLETGERVFMAELGALTGGESQFANDVTSDPDGNAYVTNTLTPVIYRVSPDGEATIWAQDEILGGDGFGLNGIDLHPDGYLLVAQAGRRQILRIPLDDPSDIHVVGIAEAFDADGLTLTAGGDLIAVATTGEGDAAATEVLRLQSSDGWETARVAGRAPAAQNATTAAVRGDAVYVVDARFADMGGETPAPHFDITRVAFR